MSLPMYITCCLCDMMQIKRRKSTVASCFPGLYNFEQRGENEQIKLSGQISVSILNLFSGFVFCSMYIGLLSLEWRVVFRQESSKEKPTWEPRMQKATITLSLKQVGDQLEFMDDRQLLLTAIRVSVLCCSKEFPVLGKSNIFDTLLCLNIFIIMQLSFCTGFAVQFSFFSTLSRPCCPTLILTCLISLNLTQASAKTLPKAKLLPGTNKCESRYMKGFSVGQFCGLSREHSHKPTKQLVDRNESIFSVDMVKRTKTMAYLLFVGSQISVHFLGLKEGWATVHSKANIQHSVLHIHQAKDVDIIRRNGEHLGKEVHQQLVAAPLLPSQFNELLCYDVWERHTCTQQEEQTVQKWAHYFHSCSKINPIIFKLDSSARLKKKNSPEHSRLGL